MKKIDRETVQRILDAADIVEVVSDFVRLKKRGANYIGLCPFHAERTPSFSVSKSRGICKCFSCGKGGSPVHFIMEHEALSYYDALRYLARKYNIEIHEHEVSEEEKEIDRQRESMFAINEWASQKFSSNLYDTQQGKDIGLSYFKERGLNDATIKKFRLGYSIDKTSLGKEAIQSGYSREYLLETGICYLRERTGELIDRFAERVIYPIFTVSGKVVAFGGRTLSSSKEVAKYVNSPESIIYSKRKELYGLFQAKTAIVKKGYCILVEGYMDVLSMSQAGIENVVASSGTALTTEQIRFIHRFTDSVTLMYDSDPAGIKAALRGVNLLLSEGLDISIVLLPEGEDPDSYAQSHSSTEVESYIEQKSEDFIKFKTKILLGEAHDDPVKRSRVISEIVESIAVIPDEIKRVVYCQECSRLLEVKEDVLARQVAIARSRIAEKKEKEKIIDSAKSKLPKTSDSYEQNVENQASKDIKISDSVDGQNINSAHDFRIKASEEEVLKYVVRYGYSYICEALDEDGNAVPMNVIEFVENDLESDAISFNTEDHKQLFEVALSLKDEWEEESLSERKRLEEIRIRKFDEGIQQIRSKAVDLADIRKRELDLSNRLDIETQNSFLLYSKQFLESRLLSHPKKEIRDLAIRLASEKHQLSRYHSRFTSVPTEYDKILELLGKALNSWKYAILERKGVNLLNNISQAVVRNDFDEVMKLMKEKLELDKKKAEFAQILGDRIYSPNH